MKKRILSIICVALAGLFLTGCDPEDNTIGDFAYDVQGASIHVTDQYGNQKNFTQDQAQWLLSQDDAAIAQFLTAEFRSDFPQSYGTGSAPPEITIIEADPGTVVVAEQVKNITAMTSAIPVPWAGFIGIAINGLLGIGAIWLNFARRKNKNLAAVALAANDSTAAAIQAWRLAVKNTDEGAELEADLKGRLKEAHERAGPQVKALIDGVLKNYAAFKAK